MCCPNLEELAAYQAGALGAGAWETLHAHIAQCDACRGELAALDRTMQAVEGLPAPLPSADLWPGIAARLPARRRVSAQGWWQTAISLGLVAGLALLLTQQRTPQLPTAPRDAASYVTRHDLLSAQDPLADRAGLGIQLMAEDGK